MEIEMSAKLLPALVVGLLLGTTALASAQMRTIDQYGGYAPYYYSTDPYFGTPFENVAPYGNYNQPDPYRGTYFDEVAPY
jgi:hypothetical protein